MNALSQRYFTPDNSDSDLRLTLSSDPQDGPLVEDLVIPSHLLQRLLNLLNDIVENRGQLHRDVSFGSPLPVFLNTVLVSHAHPHTRDPSIMHAVCRKVHDAGANLNPETASKVVEYLIAFLSQLRGSDIASNSGLLLQPLLILANLLSSNPALLTTDMELGVLLDRKRQEWNIHETQDDALEAFTWLTVVLSHRERSHPSEKSLTAYFNIFGVLKSAFDLEPFLWQSLESANPRSEFKWESTMFLLAANLAPLANEKQLPSLFEMCVEVLEAIENLLKDPDIKLSIICHPSFVRLMDTLSCAIDAIAHRALIFSFQSEVKNVKDQVISPFEIDVTTKWSSLVRPLQSCLRQYATARDTDPELLLRKATSHIIGCLARLLFLVAGAALKRPPKSEHDKNAVDSASVTFMSHLDLDLILALACPTFCGSIDTFAMNGVIHFAFTIGKLVSPMPQALMHAFPMFASLRWMRTFDGAAKLFNFTDQLLGRLITRIQKELTGNHLVKRASLTTLSECTSENTWTCAGFPPNIARHFASVWTAAFALCPALRLEPATPTLEHFFKHVNNQKQVDLQKIVCEYIVSFGSVVGCERLMKKLVQPVNIVAHNVIVSACRKGILQAGKFSCFSRQMCEDVWDNHGVSREDQQNCIDFWKFNGLASTFKVDGERLSHYVPLSQHNALCLPFLHANDSAGTPATMSSRGTMIVSVNEQVVRVSRMMFQQLIVACYSTVICTPHSHCKNELVVSFDWTLPQPRYHVMFQQNVMTVRIVDEDASQLADPLQVWEGLISLVSLMTHAWKTNVNDITLAPMCCCEQLGEVGPHSTHLAPITVFFGSAAAAQHVVVVDPAVRSWWTLEATLQDANERYDTTQFGTDTVTGVHVVMMLKPESGMLPWWPDNAMIFGCPVQTFDWSSSSRHTGIIKPLADETVAASVTAEITTHQAVFLSCTSLVTMLPSGCNPLGDDENCIIALTLWKSFLPYRSSPLPQISSFVFPFYIIESAPLVNQSDFEYGPFTEAVPVGHRKFHPGRCLCIPHGEDTDDGIFDTGYTGYASKFVQNYSGTLICVVKANRPHAKVADPILRQPGISVGTDDFLGLTSAHVFHVQNDKNETRKIYVAPPINPLKAQHVAGHLPDMDFFEGALGMLQQYNTIERYSTNDATLAVSMHPGIYIDARPFKIDVVLDGDQNPPTSQFLPTDLDAWKQHGLHFVPRLVSEVYDPAVGDEVFLVGRSVGIVRGRVLHKGVDALVYCGTSGLADKQYRTAGCLLIQSRTQNLPFSYSGDSGALIIMVDPTNQTAQPVAMLNAGTANPKSWNLKNWDKYISLATPFDAVMRALDVHMVC